jgi:putative flippase GtrA
VTRRGGHIVPGDQHPVRHGLAFVGSGTVAFAVDGTVLEMLSAGLGVHPILARSVAISLAMIAGWLMHRTYSFAVSAPPSGAEFVRYASVAWTAAAINYGLFVLIVVIAPRVAPLLAMIASSLLAMIFSYCGMRFAAFRKGADLDARTRRR